MRPVASTSWAWAFALSLCMAVPSAAEEKKYLVFLKSSVAKQLRDATPAAVADLNRKGTPAQTDGDQSKATLLSLAAGTAASKAAGVSRINVATQQAIRSTPATARGEAEKVLKAAKLKLVRAYSKTGVVTIEGEKEKLEDFEKKSDSAEVVFLDGATKIKSDLGRRSARTLAVTSDDDWHVRQVAADKVHARGYRGGGVGVAIVDTGFMRSLAQDLGNPVAVDYLPTKQFVLEDDDNGHGTAVSFVVKQIAPDAKLFSYRVFDSTGYATVEDINAAVDDALERSDVQVVNLSLGGPWEGAPAAELNFYERLADGARREGKVLVAAAGNHFKEINPNGPTTIRAPAVFDGYIAVAATDRNNQRTDYSVVGQPGSTNFKLAVKPDLAAPGDIVVRPLGSSPWRGTSMAAPIVSAAIALRMARFGESKADPDKTLAALTAATFPGTGIPLYTGAGVIDVESFVLGETDGGGSAEHAKIMVDLKSRIDFWKSKLPDPDASPNGK